MEERFKTLVIVTVVVALVVIVGIYLIMKFRSKLETQIQQLTEVNQRRDKVGAFLRLFIDKVLNTTGEVVFEERLKLENEMRELKDDQLLSLWQRFVDSKSPADAQKNLKGLLAGLAEKI